MIPIIQGAIASSIQITTTGEIVYLEVAGIATFSIDTSETNYIQIESITFQVG